MRHGATIAVLLLLAVAGVLCSLQLKAALAEKDALTRTLEEQRRAVAMGRAAQADAARVAAEQARCRGELARVREALPEELGADAFLEHAAEVAARHGVTLVAGAPQVEHNDLYDAATIAVELRGGSAEAALGELRSGPRLVGAEGFEQSEAGARVRLLLFASAAVEPRAGYRPVQLPSSSVWLPGVRGRIAGLRAQVEEAAAEAAALQEPIGQVSRLTALREELEKRRTILRALTARHGPGAATEAASSAAGRNAAFFGRIGERGRPPAPIPAAAS